MSTNTSIQWTDATWNPVMGCRRVSAGCENCYAEKIAARFSGRGQAFEALAKRRTNGVADSRMVLDRIFALSSLPDLRGPYGQFMANLTHDIGFDGFSALGWHHLFSYLRATPEQICRAALPVLEKEAMAGET
jgi:protein gp37